MKNTFIETRGKSNVMQQKLFIKQLKKLIVDDSVSPKECSVAVDKLIKEKKNGSR